MRPSLVKAAVKQCIKTRSPIMVWGAPGIGKSDIIREIVAEENAQIAAQPAPKGKSKAAPAPEPYGLVDFRLAMRDPTSIMGFPMPDQKTSTMKFFRDGELPTSGRGLLFMDEINSATPATQAAAMQLTLDRKIGDYVLPDGWDIVAAGNRESDRAVVSRMPSALSLRFKHVDMEPNLEDFCNWAIKKDLPRVLIAFLRFKPDLLHSFNPDMRSSPNPRSWVRVTQDINQGLPLDVEHALVQGTIGDGAAGEFTAFMRVWRDLPSIDQILLNPKGTQIPTSPNVLYAISTSLSMNAKADTFDRLMQYVERMPKEFQVLTVRDAALQHREVCNTKSFLDWSIANQDTLS